MILKTNQTINCWTCWEIRIKFHTIPWGGLSRLGRYRSSFSAIVCVLDVLGKKYVSCPASLVLALTGRASWSQCPEGQDLFFAGWQTSLYSIGMRVRDWFVYLFMREREGGKGLDFLNHQEYSRSVNCLWPRSQRADIGNICNWLGHSTLCNK